MSANNYSICPKCKADKMAEQSQFRQEADDAYGKIPIGQYAELDRKASEPFRLEPTLAEYYEIGIDQKGEFKVDYSASCDACGFDFSFRNKEKAMR